MGFAITTLGTRSTTNAVEKARRAWSDMARETRTDIRSMGLHGDLPRLDDIASGARGAAVPKGIHALAKEMRDCGIPEADAMQRLTDRVRFIVALTYHEDTGAA